MTNSESILSGLRIVDLSRGRSGQLASMLLAEAGASVVLVEPEGGHPDRGGAAFAVHNRSKYSMTLDNPDDIDALLAKADILIHDRSDAFLSDAALRARHPHLISSHIGSWPNGHPNASTPVNDALVLAESGICDEQRAVNRDGPIYLRFPLGEGGAAYLAAIAVLARLVAGKSGAANTSIVQGALTSVIMLWSRAEHPTKSLEGGYNKAINAYQFECADGLWMHVMSNPDHCPTMRAGLDALDAEVRNAAIAERSGAPVVPSFGANSLVFKQYTRSYWLDELWANDVSVQPVLPMGDLYNDEQARVNGYVVEVDDPVLGKTLQPGSPMQIDPPACVQRPAPTLDDGRNVVAAWDSRPPLLAIPEVAYPLQGLKVLDLGNFLAGPFAAMILSSLGAEVIKLEAATGDMMRHAEWAFAACQRGKRSIALNLKDPAGRPVLEKLVKWADVVHHNLRMPAAIKLGLDYPTLKAINPDIVYCHVSSYGPIGPRKDWPGFDQLFQASCGWEYEGAGADNPPIWYRFGMMDHQCAMASTIATLLALHKRKETGEGGFVAASLLGGGMMTLRETVVLPDGGLAPYPKLDSGQMGVSQTRRLVQCSDGWIMIVTDAPIEGLEAVSVDEALAKVRARGGQAVRARENQRETFLSDPANRAAKLAVSYNHKIYGQFEQIGTFFDFGDLDTRFDRAPPVLGEHSREILAEFGFNTQETETMVASGLVVAP